MRRKIRENGNWQEKNPDKQYWGMCFMGFVRPVGFVGFETLITFPFQQLMLSFQLVLVTWADNAEHSTRRHKDRGGVLVRWKEKAVPVKGMKDRIKDWTGRNYSPTAKGSFTEQLLCFLINWSQMIKTGVIARKRTDETVCKYAPIAAADWLCEM